MIGSEVALLVEKGSTHSWNDDDFAEADQVGNAGSERDREEEIGEEGEVEQLWSHGSSGSRLKVRRLEKGHWGRASEGSSSSLVALKKKKWEPFGPRQEESYPRTLFSDCVRFMDIVESYQPDLCLRQFRYKQMIHGPIVPLKAHRPSSGIGHDVEVGPLADHLWESWENHRVHRSKRSTPVSFPGEVERTYESWFRGVSHPFIIDPDHRDTPLPRDDVVVTVETAHALLDQFGVARRIVDDAEKLKFFRRMMKDVVSLIDDRLGRRKPCKGHTPDNRVQRYPMVFVLLVTSCRSRVYG
ncbi:hypothetical protein KSS87_001052 [Heliosperma pusillum]|nr:hypothetical protein KSS87_001052 [Heliosperma pusillum]